MSTVPEYTGTVPKRTQSQSEFNTNVQDILDYQVTLAPAINIVADEVNTNATNASTSETNASTSETNAEAFALEAAASANATVYSGTTTYNYPDTVIGSDGNAYRCLGSGVIGDDPVGSVTGNWLSLAGVDLTSDQTIEGVKGFIESPTVPTPTTSGQAVNKQFITDNVATPTEIRTGTDNEKSTTPYGISDTTLVGSAWVDISGSRALDVTYTNSSGKPIMVNYWDSGVAPALTFSVDGLVVASMIDSSGTSLGFDGVIVPHGSNYSISGGVKAGWVELR